MSASTVNGSLGEKRAAEVLVRSGFVVEKNRRHLYKLPSGRYVVLRFTNKGDLLGGENKDSEFEDCNEALEVFFSEVTGDA